MSGTVIFGFPAAAIRLFAFAMFVLKTAQAGVYSGACAFTMLRSRVARPKNTSFWIWL